MQIEVTAAREVADECPLKSFRFYKTKEFSTGFYEIKTGAKNIRTPWWDASVIYGSNGEVLKRLRTLKDGKIKISEEGELLHNENGIAVSGDVRNSWAGVSTLQALFVHEHNSVCDALKKNYPELDDEEIYRHARLVTSAVIAKIHTIDWTVELLKTDTLLAGMRANWYGLLGKKFKDTFGHVGGKILGGLVGLKRPNNHGVPYSLTEQFVSVYRMHSLLPDNLQLRDISATPGPNKSPPLIKEIPMKNLIGLEGEKTLTKIGIVSQIVSMGHQACGALELWNYPMWLRDLIPQNLDGSERPDHVDLPVLEIYRDRERNVARYNQFRRALLLIPISKWEDLTDDKEAIEVLEDVYGDDVEELDLLVGLMAEKKIKGFAISETAFIIFLLMATRSHIQNSPPSAPRNLFFVQSSTVTAINSSQRCRTVRQQPSRFASLSRPSAAASVACCHRAPLKTHPPVKPTPPPDCASTHAAAEVYLRPIAVRLVSPQQAPIPASRPSPVAHRRFLLRGGVPSCNLSFLRRQCCNKR
ncbi:alpha-dioxygenase PIOX-like isoform X1 [Arachis duranensis]|uniref:Alpha-dioxygenase PIOX-like isoform X1 n=1 Tax=Arachis duranensis TaxID=130453 RepID=A0A9C6TZS8_ARADU|nr:alpha-dioxygenase PIOX-like isoform X1 [Arachis duranensis]